jgi:hypothetical protein
MRGARIVGVLVVVVVWLALFEVPSAVAIGRGAPRWLALTAGLVPLLAVFGWHAWRERRRVKSGTLRGWDRLVLRTVAVAAVAGGASWAVARPSLAAAVRHHARWMLPHDASALAADSKLIALVPSSAETIVWVREGDAQALTQSLEAVPWLASLAGKPFELVGAMSEHDKVMLAVDGSDQVADSIQRLLARVGVEDSRPAAGPGGAKVWSSASWTPLLGTGRPAALLAMFDRAPDDAVLLIAARQPHLRKADASGPDPAAFVGWLRGDEDEVELGADIEAGSEADGAKLEAELALARSKKEGPCFDSVSGVSLSVTRDGLWLHVRVRIEQPSLAPLFTCFDHAS